MDLIFVIIGAIIGYPIGVWLYHKWEDRPLTEKQKKAIIEWETKNSYLPPLDK